MALNNAFKLVNKCDVKRNVVLPSEKLQVLAVGNLALTASSPFLPNESCLAERCDYEYTPKHFV